MDYEIVERATGDVILRVVHLWPNDGGECAMCGQERALDHSVGWYCGPTHDEIGSVTTEYTDGGIVGGMRVCKECHDGFYQQQARET